MLMKPQVEWKLAPIRGIEIYNSDIVVKRYGHKNHSSPGKRGKVKEFTLPARKRLAFVAANTSIDFTAMITLTYPEDYPQNGRESKAHRKQFLWWLKHGPWALGTYLWFIEFQRRGAPHYHILLLERVGNAASFRRFQWDVAHSWNGIIDGDNVHLQQGTHTERLRSSEGGRHYCVKYAQKMRQKIVPAAYENVGRFYGYSRDVKPSPVMELTIGWEGLKRLLGSWEYLPDNQQDLYRVLFNTAGTVAANAVQLGLGIDNHT
jgi:hypothetical protein